VLPSHFLLDIALILLSTKVFGLITKKFRMPQVVGALLAGILFGPACLNILHSTDLLSSLSSLGVVVLMFSAGMETDISQLRKNGKAGFLVALIGVVVPLIMGMIYGMMFHTTASDSNSSIFLQHLFIGVILTATSVSITVETLKEIGTLNTQVGNCILAAALIDDILGLICLTIISSLAGSGDISIPIVLVKIVLFFLLAIAFGLLVKKFVTWYSHRFKDVHMRRFPVLAFVFCLVMAYVAEEFFGVADIIGAFSAGLIIGSTPQAPYIESRFRPLSYMLLTPIFFAYVGIGIDLSGMTPSLLFATAVLILFALISKLIGCGLGAKICGMTTRQSVQVGLGMVCRGEVALIVAQKGQAMGLMPANLLAPIIIMVVITAIVTPILLKAAFAKDEVPPQLQESALVDRVQVAEQLDAVNHWLLAMDHNLRKTGELQRTQQEQKKGPQ